MESLLDACVVGRESEAGCLRSHVEKEVMLQTCRNDKYGRTQSRIH